MNSIYKTIGILGGATEALQIASEGVADFATIDRILREHTGFKLGPFQLLDIAGIDVAHDAISTVYQNSLNEPRYRPSNIAMQHITEGKLGKKTDVGFYTYVNGEAHMPIEPATPNVAEMPPVWVSTRAMRRPELLQLLKDLGAKIETGASPSAQALSIVAPLGFDVTTVAIVERLDPARTVGIDMLIDDKLTHRRVLATCPATRADMRDAAHALFTRDGKAVTVIRDSGGFVTQRVVANIINIACDMCQQGLCTPEELEATGAADLGHSMGPLSMGNKYGPTEILEVLFNVQTVYGDTRYRPSPWLRRRGALGLSLMHVEG
jgi:3-hydroxybutyryl-CoA dehydrogenase